MRLVNVSKVRGEALRNVYYCGRASASGAIVGGHDLSVLGNPFVIGRDGTRAEVIAKYRRWLWARISEGDRVVIAALKSLTEGVTLGCWCTERADATAGELECHGQVIARAYRWWMEFCEKWHASMN